MRTTLDFYEDDENEDEIRASFDTWMVEAEPARIVDPPGVLRVQPWRGITVSGNHFVPSTHTA